MVSHVSRQPQTPKEVIDHTPVTWFSLLVTSCHFYSSHGARGFDRSDVVHYVLKTQDQLSSLHKNLTNSIK